MIAHVCLCGSEVWEVLCTFDEYQISGYYTVMHCAACGRESLAPTEIDKPGYTPDNNVTV